MSADTWDDSPDPLNTPEPDLTERGAEPDTTPAPWLAPPVTALQTEPPPVLRPDMFGIPTPAPKLFPHRIPNLGNAALFFALVLVLLVVGQVLGVFLLQLSHLLPHRSFYSLYLLVNTDARVSIPVQALCYGLIVLVAIPVFTVLWDEPFGEGVRWNAGQAQRRLIVLAILGLVAGFGITFFGNYLPMPKNPPITQDMMKSATGAWMMLVFGLTVAPILEELAFRGFLLPGLLNSFRWFADRGIISQKAARWVGIPISILLTSAGFAFMHSPQVSHSWGPLVLIGAVSIVLCIVRLAMDSVAASVIVHAAYNFTLFAGVLYQTGGFRHLEKLTS
ncbi:MAG: CPBP family glutamic-type intramembrane protease [Silvibacterium sp.]